MLCVVCGVWCFGCSAAIRVLRYVARVGDLTYEKACDVVIDALDGKWPRLVSYTAGKMCVCVCVCVCGCGCGCGCGCVRYEWRDLVSYGAGSWDTAVSFDMLSSAVLDLEEGGGAGEELQSALALVFCSLSPSAGGGGGGSQGGGGGAVIGGGGGKGGHELAKMQKGKSQGQAGGKSGAVGGLVKLEVLTLLLCWYKSSTKVQILTLRVQALAKLLLSSTQWAEIKADNHARKAPPPRKLDLKMFD